MLKRKSKIGTLLLALHVLISVGGNFQGFEEINYNQDEDGSSQKQLGSSQGKSQSGWKQMAKALFKANVDFSETNIDKVADELNRREFLIKQPRQVSSDQKRLTNYKSNRPQTTTQINFIPVSANNRLFMPNMFPNRLLSPMEKMRPTMKLEKHQTLKNWNRVQQAEGNEFIDVMGQDSEQRKKRHQDHDDKKPITMDDVQILPFKVSFLRGMIPSEVTEQALEESTGKISTKSPRIDLGLPTPQNSRNKRFNPSFDYNSSALKDRFLTLEDAMSKQVKREDNQFLFSNIGLFQAPNSGKSKIIEFVRRKSCISSFCDKVPRERIQRLGDKLVLDEEKEMIVRFQKLMAAQILAEKAAINGSITSTLKYNQIESKKALINFAKRRQTIILQKMQSNLLISSQNSEDNNSLSRRTQQPIDEQTSSSSDTESKSTPHERINQAQNIKPLLEKQRIKEAMQKSRLNSKNQEKIKSRFLRPNQDQTPISSEQPANAQEKPKNAIQLKLNLPNKAQNSQSSSTDNIAQPIKFGLRTIKTFLPSANQSPLMRRAQKSQNLSPISTCYDASSSSPKFENQQKNLLMLKLKTVKANEPNNQLGEKLLQSYDGKHQLRNVQQKAATAKFGLLRTATYDAKKFKSLTDFQSLSILPKLKEFNADLEQIEEKIVPNKDAPQGFDFGNKIKDIRSLLESRQGQKQKRRRIQISLKKPVSSVRNQILSTYLSQDLISNSKQSRGKNIA